MQENLINKTKLFFIITFISLTIIGCANNFYKKQMKLEIDIQNFFENELVLLNINNERIFGGTILTDESIGLAASLVTKTEKKLFKIDITLPDLKNTNRNFSFEGDIDNGSIIGICYDEERIFFEQVKEPFIYD